MGLDKIEVFCAVARSMSFSKAAQECHMSQSTVSQQIKSLESELGFALFERSTRSVTFTKAGEIYYLDCVRIMESLDEAYLRASSISDGKSRSITIGIEGMLQGDIRTRTIQEFGRRYPNISIIPKEMNPHTKYEQLYNCEIDIVFDLVRYYKLNQNFRLFGASNNEHVLMLSKDHPYADRPFVTKKELAKITSFLGGVSIRENYLRDYYVDYFRESGIEPENILNVPSQSVAVMMVAVGIGGNIVPVMNKPWWNPEVFAFVPLRDKLCFESAWVHSVRNNNPALPVFIDLVNELSQNY